MGFNLRLQIRNQSNIRDKEKREYTKKKRLHKEQEHKDKRECTKI